MSSDAFRPYRVPVLGAAVVLALLHVLMVAGDLGDSYAGYVRDDDDVVTLVGEGSPAQQAGLRVGDRLIAIAGRSLDRVPDELTTPGAPIGTEVAFTVERADESLELTVRYGPRPASSSRSAMFRAGRAIATLLLGTAAFWYVQNGGALTLALAWICIGSLGLWARLPGAYADGADAAATAFGLVFLLHHFLVAPEAKRMIARAWVAPALYVVAAGLTVLNQGLLVAGQPGVRGAIKGSAELLLVVAILAAMIHGVVATDREKRRGYGLYFFPAACAIFIAVQVLDRAISVHPAIDLVALSLLPLSLSWSVLRTERFRLLAD